VERRDPHVLAPVGENAAAVGREPVPRIGGAELGQGPATDRTGEIGGAVERLVVDHHRGAVPGEPDVELERVGALLHRQLEGRQGVLRRVGRGAPMGDDRPGVDVEQRVHGPAS